MFLLVPAYPGCPGSKAVKRSLLLLLLLLLQWRFFNILDALPKQVLIATDSMTLHMDSQQFQSIPCPHTHTHTHPFNGPLSRTIRVSRYQKGKPIWILLKQETVSGSGISCTSLQTDNHASTQALRFYRPDALPAAQPTASKH